MFGRHCHPRYQHGCGRSSDCATTTRCDWCPECGVRWNGEAKPYPRLINRGMVIGGGDEDCGFIVGAGNQFVGKLRINHRGLREDVLFTTNLVYTRLCTDSPVGVDAARMCIGCHIIAKRHPGPV